MTLLRSFATIPDLLWYITGGFVDLRGLPINSFGFFVAMAFLVGGWVIHKELLRRKEAGLFTGIKQKQWFGRPPRVQDVLPSALMGFFLGWKVLGLYLMRDEIGGRMQEYLLSGDGHLPAGIIGALLFGGLRYYNIKREELNPPEEREVTLYPHDMVGDIVVVAAIFGVLGANVFEIINDPAYFRAFLQDPIGSMFSGMTIVGGLIFGIISLLTFAWLRKIPIPHLFDALGPAVMLAYAVGRIGCQVSGDGDWGIENTLDKPAWIPEVLWRQHYAHNVIDEGVLIPGCEEVHCYILDVGRFPTPVYETVVCGLLFLLLWQLRKPMMAFPGMLWGLFMVFNGIERFFIEFIRITKRHEVFGFSLTQAQINSLSFILIGCALMALTYWLGKRKGPA